jgi:hypothetical protein
VLSLNGVARECFCVLPNIIDKISGLKRSCTILYGETMHN